jgi:recombining binding protein (suppressor of hairless)
VFEFVITKTLNDSQAFLVFPTSVLDSHSWQRRYPWRETVMRTFHPFSSPHISMPDAAHLDAHLHQAASKSSSPRPPSPSLDILVDTTSPPAEHIPHSAQLLPSVKPPNPSSINGVVNHTHSTMTVTAASVLSNPDPSASLQSILAASRKDHLPPESALHQWAIPPPPPQLAASHHVTLLPQVSPSLAERLNASLFTLLPR